MIDQQSDIYMECIRQQLEEVDMLSSIYCAPGEMHIYDPSVISDFNEFLASSSVEPVDVLRAHLDYAISLPLTHGKSKEKLEVRIELPHLYPAIENAVVITHSPLLSKEQEMHFRARIAAYIASFAEENRNETYVFQVLSWIQEEIESVLNNASRMEDKVVTNDTAVPLKTFERLWIYSHHIKSKTKRQEIVRQCHSLELSGFSRPGKPGIICVEGLQERTQEFWRIIRAMRWQKISICKSEVKVSAKFEKLRRFEGFHEQLFCVDADNDEGVMDMGQFFKYLELHNSGYMKKELFGLD